MSTAQELVVWAIQGVAMLVVAMAVGQHFGAFDGVAAFCLLLIFSPRVFSQ